MDKYLNQTLTQASNLLSKGNINAAINIFDTLSYKYPKNGLCFEALIALDKPFTF